MPVADLVVIGAGPVGLEAAALASRQEIEAVVVDAGRVAEHVGAWGSARLFSPFGLNAGPAGARLLADDGFPLSEPSGIMTGDDFRESYLLPLAARLRSRVDIREGVRVRDIARAGLLKGEAAGSPARAGQPFRLLCNEKPAAEGPPLETEIFARAVFDCSGTYGQPNWAGPGGAAALGERAVRREIEYRLPDPLGQHRDRYAGKRTLLLGSGHSAAATAIALAELARTAAGTTFAWASRGQAATPLPVIEGDRLPERARLSEEANAVAAAPPPGCSWLRAAQLASVEKSGSGGFEVGLNIAGAGRRRTRFDRIVANVGYEPDDGLYRQLQVHACYASMGPMGTAAALIEAGGGTPADCCLAGRDFGPETLRTPEPGFFILGAKSYGKNSAFLMRTGYEQAAAAFSLLARP